MAAEDWIDWHEEGKYLEDFYGDWYDEEDEMAELKTGVVQYVNENDTRVGKTYNIRLEGDDRYFGTYKSFPQCTPGQVVEFTFSTNGQGFHNIDMKKGITVLETAVATSDGAAAAAVQTPDQTERAAAASAKADGKDKKITWQSARNSAIAALRVAADAGCLDIGGGNKGGKFEALQILINQQTLEYFNDSVKVQETGEDPFQEEV